MSTKDNEILESVRKGMELRKTLERTVSEALGKNLHPDMVICELELVKIKLSGLMAGITYEKCKEAKNEH